MSAIQQVLAGIGGQGAPVTATYIASVSDSGVSASPKTFTAASIGTASADRYVALAINYGNVSSENVSAVTVAGVTCTRRAQRLNGNGFSSEIWVSNTPVASGTTGDIVVTGLASGQLAVAVFTLTGGLLSTTATATGGVTADATGFSVSVSAGGAIISCGRASGAASSDQSGTTEVVDSAIGGSLGNHSAGLLNSATADSINVNYDFGGSPSTVTVVAAAFR